MAHAPLPFVLEDRTNLAASGTDFDDIYDRLFLRVVPRTSAPDTCYFSAQPAPSLPFYSPAAALAISPSSSTSSDGTDPPGAALAVYDMPHRWSPRRADAHRARVPAAVLRFCPSGRLGVLALRGKPEVPMGKWLARTGLFAGYAPARPPAARPC
jgi:hypothetical protein